jgi:hypothetical protein
MKVNLLHIRINEHSPIFSELLELLEDSLRQLGVSVFRTTNEVVLNCTNVVIGHTCFLTPRQFEKLVTRSPSYIVFQAEALDHQSGFIGKSPAYLAFLQGASQIWDYSESNIDFLVAKGLHNAVYIPLGYSAALERVPQSLAKETNVLFYGAKRPRRTKIMDALESRGVSVKYLFGCYGEERDKAIGRSKVILNVHQFDTNQLEQVRLAYLLNNKCFVISESADCDPYGNGVVFCEYHELVDTCQQYVATEMELSRSEIAVRGYQALKRIAMTDYLKKARLKSPNRISQADTSRSVGNIQAE